MPNANHVNLVQNIERLQLNVDRILPLHSRVVPMSELLAAIGRWGLGKSRGKRTKSPVSM